MCRICIFIVGLCLFGPPAWAGAGHDHGPEAGPNNVAHIPRVESAGSELELLAIAESRKLTIYLDKLDTNEPVDGAIVEVSGESIEPQTATRVDEGVYVIEADWIQDPGTKALTFVVTTGETTDLLGGMIEIPSDIIAEADDGVTWSAILARTELWALLGLAALIGFVSAFAFCPIRLSSKQEQDEEPSSPPQLSVVKQKKLARTLFLILGFGLLLSTSAMAGAGHDHGEGGTGTAQIGGDSPRKLPEGDVFVPKRSQRLLRIRTAVTTETRARPGTELVGGVVADPSFEGRVQAPMDGVIELADGGVSFVGHKVTAGDVLAQLAPSMPVYERGALEQMVADVEGKLRVAEQRLARLTGVTKGYAAQGAIEDAQVEVESLREQKRKLEPKPVEKLALKAPVSGIISVANVRPGQVVNARDTLFEIVDPTRLWVEAMGAGGLVDYSAIETAHALHGKGEAIRLSYVGQSPILRQHSRPIYFKIDDPRRALAIGTTVKVILQTDDQVEGIVLPGAAVVRGVSGLPQVWAKTGAERFKPLPVKTVALDGRQVLVIAGLGAGDRVVVEGAELINQVR
jgi:cobalt-zinc-cadmium efflux system membrane fusion protein